MRVRKRDLEGGGDRVMGDGCPRVRRGEGRNRGNRMRFARRFVATSVSCRDSFAPCPASLPCRAVNLLQAVRARYQNTIESTCVTISRKSVNFFFSFTLHPRACIHCNFYDFGVWSAWKAWRLPVVGTLMCFMFFRFFSLKKCRVQVRKGKFLAQWCF